MLKGAGIILVACLAAGAAQAASEKKKGTQFWNLTGVTLKEVRLAPAGTTKWGPNLTKADDDGTVDFDERLPVTIAAGTYDVRMKDMKNRTCMAEGVKVVENEVFSVHVRDLKNCPWR